MQLSFVLIILYLDVNDKAGWASITTGYKNGHSRIVYSILCSRDETILQYIDILQYLLRQYNTIWLKGNINILHIAIYCDILQYIAIFVVLML